MRLSWLQSTWTFPLSNCSLLTSGALIPISSLRNTDVPGSLFQRPYLLLLTQIVLPFAPFVKTDKKQIGKCFDFVQSRYPGAAKEEEDNFKTLESKNAYKSRHSQLQTKKQITAKQQNAQANAPSRINYPRFNNKKAAAVRPPYQRTYHTKPRFKEFSMILPHWGQRAEVQINPSDKMAQTKLVINSKEIMRVGQLREYDNTIEFKANPKRPLTVVQEKGTLLPFTVEEDDEFMGLIAKHDAMTWKSEDIRVYIPDYCLSFILSASRGPYPWGLSVRKTGNKLIIEYLPSVQQNAYTLVELDTVNEMANISLPEDEGEYLKLGLETYKIQAQMQKLTRKEVIPGGKPHSQADFNNNLYIYKQWSMVPFVTNPDHRYEVFVRSEVNSSEGENLVNVRAINEYDFSTNLRTRLDQSKGACLGEEIRNNSAKVTRWYSQLVLAGAKVLKIAYTSRAAQKDLSKHEVLYVDSLDLNEINQYISFNFEESWKILKNIVDYFIDEKDGEYAAYKIIGKPIMKVYHCEEKKESEEEEENMDEDN